MTDQNEQYLVIQTGYEGIDRICGIFNKDKAIEMIMKYKSVAENNKKIWEEYTKTDISICELIYSNDALTADEKYDNYSSHPDVVAIREKLDREHDINYANDPDFYCVVTVNEEGTKCVCKELGVTPSKPMLR